MNNVSQQRHSHAAGTREPGRPRNALTTGPRGRQARAGRAAWDSGLMRIAESPIWSSKGIYLSHHTAHSHPSRDNSPLRDRFNDDIASMRRRVCHHSIGFLSEPSVALTKYTAGSLACCALRFISRVCARVGYKYSSIQVFKYFSSAHGGGSRSLGELGDGGNGRRARGGLRHVRHHRRELPGF